MKTRTLTLIGIAITFELVSLGISRRGLSLDGLTLVSLAFAASMAGRAVAYLTVFEWLREPFTKIAVHSSGVGESVEPRDDHGPAVAVIGSLISCPVCAGVWSAALLLTVYAFEPALGRTMIYILGAGGLAQIVTRLVELLEWQGRHTWEQTGFMNRLNKNKTEIELIEKRANGHVKEHTS